MSTGVKNGKHRTNNIYILKILLLLNLLIFLSYKASAQGGDKNWVIVIDAGHGGKDPGAVGSFSFEKNLTLAVALKTGSYIEKNLKNATVVYTRKTDTFVEVRERANIANKNNADLFISIHANSVSSKSPRGTETFVMGPAKDEQNLEVAMKENEVILLENDYSTSYEGFDPKSPESYIMFTLMQNIFLKQSTSLASAIQSQYREKNYRYDRGVKQAGFYVLFMTTMPSVLTEIGFITHPEEEKYLNSKEGQDNLALSIFRACSAYITDIESKSSKLPVKNQNIDREPDNFEQSVYDQGSIVFMVQIATSSGKIETKPENFKGLKDVTEIPGQDLSKYATGSFSDYMAAVNYRKEIESIFPDAFVIAVKDNKILPLQQALDEMKENIKRDSK
ncbi:MAG: N-acetylmuramoyl-L-alanine amidase [Bacteroidales bacterium]|nr:N-acetylmuramoyl-L-alanine amidase [Bacteroidales bacterium]